MNPIKQSTPIAADRRVYFTSVSAAALQTRLAAASLGTWVVYLAKNGGTPAIPNGGATLVEVGSTNEPGVWYLQLAAADCDTPGQLVIKITNTSGATAMEPREIVVDIERAYMATVSSGTTTAITCDRGESTANYFKDALVEVLSGALIGQVKKIGSYTTGVITLHADYAFTGAFSNGDVIEIRTH